MTISAAVLPATVSLQKELDVILCSWRGENFREWTISKLKACRRRAISPTLTIGDRSCYSKTSRILTQYAEVAVRVMRAARVLKQLQTQAQVAHRKSSRSRAPTRPKPAHRVNHPPTRSRVDRACPTRAAPPPISRQTIRQKTSFSQGQKGGKGAASRA